MFGFAFDVLTFAGVLLLVADKYALGGLLGDIVKSIRLWITNKLKAWLEKLKNELAQEL